MSEIETGVDEHGGKIADNIVHFARVLRNAGLRVGPASVVDAIRAVEVGGIGSREDFYWTLHAVFVTKREQRPVFREAFDLFWRERGLLEKMLELLSPQAPAARAAEKPKAGESRAHAAMNAGARRREELLRPQVEVDARLTSSEREVLQSKDFAQMSAEEIRDALRLVAEMRLPFDRVPTRRRIASAKGALSPRHTMGATLRTGGDIIVPRYRERAEVHPPVVALCDISGSMSQYVRVFLHFLHALTESRRRVATFLFGTRLTNVTRSLQMKDPDEALDACAGAVLDWSGGTRIASALHAFNRDWSRRVLGQGAIVLLITDGLERTDEAGGPDLAFEMDRLHRSCRRLVWLNPLLRFERFEAKAAGVRAMLPHVDEFRPVHNMESLADLVSALADPRDAAYDPRRHLAKQAA